MPSTWLRALTSEERFISELPILEGRLALALLRNGQTAYAVSQGQNLVLKIKSDS